MGYPSDRLVLMEDAWGNAVYFVVSGWVKVRRRLSPHNSVALAILGRGDFFGEMAILDESARSNDPQLHHRMLQLMVKRLRQTNVRYQLRHRPPAVKLANTLVELAETYGQTTEKKCEIFN